MIKEILIYSSDAQRIEFDSRRKILEREGFTISEARTHSEFNRALTLLGSCVVIFLTPLLDEPLTKRIDKRISQQFSAPIVGSPGTEPGGTVTPIPPNTLVRVVVETLKSL